MLTLQLERKFRIFSSLENLCHLSSSLAYLDNDPSHRRPFKKMVKELTRFSKIQEENRYNALFVLQDIEKLLKIYSFFLTISDNFNLFKISDVKFKEKVIHDLYKKAYPEKYSRKYSRLSRIKFSIRKINNVELFMHIYNTYKEDLTNDYLSHVSMILLYEHSNEFIVKFSSKASNKLTFKKVWLKYL